MAKDIKNNLSESNKEKLGHGYKEVHYGKKSVRRNYARVQTNADLPDLVEIQTSSFNWFLNEGLKDLFDEISPIKDHNNGEKFELTIKGHKFSEPNCTIEEAKAHDIDYSSSLNCTISLLNKTVGEMTEEEVFMGNYPMMTPQGTFIIGGSERVIVTQIVRSSSVFFSSKKDKKTGQSMFTGQIIPTRGAWIEFGLGSKNCWQACLDRKSKIPLTTFIRSLGIPSVAEMANLFIGQSIESTDGTTYEVSPVLASIFSSTIEKDESFGVDDGMRILYNTLRPGEKTSVEQTRKTIAGILFENRRYDLAHVGRYKVNAKLDVIQRAIGFRLANDFVDNKGNVLITAGTEISHKAVVKVGDDTQIIDTVEILNKNRNLLRKTYKYDVMLEGDSVVLETLDIIVRTPEGDVSLRLQGNDQREKVTHITLSDIFATISYYIDLHIGVGNTDDIDHLGNRRLRLIGELLQNKFRMGLMKVEKSIRDKMSTTTDVQNVSPKNIVSSGQLEKVVKEFFSTNQLSQFMDQINPLAELTHKRRLSALGDGGITRERASFEVRDVHPSHYGRICPVETPEGQNIGLINSLASFARANKYGFIETPYFVVKNNKDDADYKAGKVPAKVWITDEVVYFNAYDEEKYNIAQANVNMMKDETTGEVLITDDEVLARHNLEFKKINKMDIDYIDVAPKQVVAVGTACIPFLEHDDTTRALMGANMQRQAIPLLKPESPIVGTGIEYKVAHDAGVAVIADCDGVVSYVDGLVIKVKDAKGKIHSYPLTKYDRSNNSTCANQKPIVMPGEEVKVGDVLADGQSMENGELALGRNVVVAFMTWNGYNFEDAVIMSERMVQDDVYTSIHIEEYVCEARDTKLGKETITRELNGESHDSISHLDENGIIIVGSEVKEGDTLVGKLTPKGETEPSPEERLSRALFPDLSKDVRVTSLKVPHGGNGIVLKTEIFTRDSYKKSVGPGYEEQMMDASKKTVMSLPSGVNEIVRVYIVQKRKISEGDKMSGRHGNKGVISNIVPIEDMPFMSDGTPVDIMLNPQGVPSRMNIGQVLEIHLGMAAKKLGVKVVTPVFDGVTKGDLIDIMNEARDHDLAIAESDPKKAPFIIDEDGKTYLYDGRTGRQFDNKICVGVMYMIKLAHMVDDKIHARSDGPYTLVTQQPMGGKAQNGGQRFGEMEVWALEAYGAAHTLQEMMTIKSDDIIGRNNVYRSIVEGTPIPDAGVPEAFRAMVKELQGLGLSVKLYDSNGHDVVNDSLVGEMEEAKASKKAMMKED